MIFKVTFHLDGTGVYYDPSEPLHLDALLAFALSKIHCKNVDITRDDTPDEIPLPLMKQHFGPEWVWCASALFPEGDQADGLVYWRKKFRTSFADWTSGSPNLTNGIYREYNMPVPLTLCHRMVAWGDGNRKACLRLLRKNIKSLGKKRAHGHGNVTAIEAVEDNEVASAIFKDGHTLRFIPDESAERRVRPRPPYWNINGAVKCAEIGTKITKGC